MESVLFLSLMLALIALGTAIVLLRAREPKGEYRGITTFEREMRALAPDGSKPTDGAARPFALDPLLPVVPSNDEVGPQPADRQE